MNISFKGDHVVRSSAMSNFPDPLKVSSEEYRERVSRCIHSEVRMLSCINNRTPPSNSKTVFNLPEDSGPGAAGGPCTYSILESLQRRSKCPSWTDLLYDMNIMLQLKGFDQIPQLSSTSDICLTTPFSILKDGYVAKKALFIGINYSGQVPGEIKGCHSDVDNMKKFILGQGYEAAGCCWMTGEIPCQRRLQFFHPSSGWFMKLALAILSFCIFPAISASCLESPRRRPCSR